MKSKERIRYMALTAVIAALYAVLTYAAAALNLAFGPIQIRFSEALTVLPIFTPAAIPGLSIGCLLSNIMSPYGIIDWVFGTAATLGAAIATRAVSKFRVKNIPILAPMMPVVFNTVVIGFEIACFSSAGDFAFNNFTAWAFITSGISVGLGELVVCYGLGLPLIMVIEKQGLDKRIFSLNNQNIR